LFQQVETYEDLVVATVVRTEFCILLKVLSFYLTLFWLFKYMTH